MILLDINNNICDEFTLDSHSDSNITKKYITIRFVNNYQNYDNNDENIIDKNIKIGDMREVQVKLCKFLGSGSYGKVYKIKMKNKYYALKISENEKPNNLLMRYESLVNIDQLKKYIIKIFIAGNIKCKKYNYFSIMEFGGQSLKSIIPLESPDELAYILRQLYNIVHLCSKFRLCLTDFKLNNIVIGKEDSKLKLIDLYMECKSYSPCKECKVVKTYSTLELDKIRNILDDENYYHSYHYISLGIGLMDLVCTKSASQIILSLAHKFNLNLSVKQIIPLIQVSCYNYTHNSNTGIKEYEAIYICKKKIEKKYEITKDKIFYETLISLIEVREKFNTVITSKKLHIILHCLFSAYHNDRTLEPLKKHLSDNT